MALRRRIANRCQHLMQGPHLLHEELDEVLNRLHRHLLVVCAQR